MNKPYKEIYDFMIEKSRVMILGVYFMLAPVATQASNENIIWQQSITDDYTNGTGSSTASYNSIEFQLVNATDKWQSVLDELSQYPDNWDAEGAKAISAVTIANCKIILNDTSKYESLLDDIFPTELGSLCMQWYNADTKALVNAEVASDRMAFYADAPEMELLELRPSAFREDSIDKLVAALEILL